MTDALQQRSRYQCTLKNAALLLGNSFYLQCSILHRLRFFVISIYTRKAYEKRRFLVNVVGRLQKVHTNKTDKNIL